MINDFRFAYRFLVIAGRDAEIEDLTRAFYESAASKGINKVIWEAFTECVRIEEGKGGSLHRLKELATAHPDCSEVFGLLARAFSTFGQFADAARIYEIAAEKTDDSRRKVILFGRAAVEYARNGASEPAVAKCSNNLRTYAQTSQDLETEALYALKSLAESQNDWQSDIAIMQRLIELDPSNTKTRFSLAFKHEESGNNDLSLFHYSKIPFSARDAGTWNNLGVSLDNFGLKSHAVEAYRKAEAAGETLAMSNLAFKFISEGFLVEARDLCEAAIKQPHFHSNVPLALARMSEKYEEEEKKLDSLQQKLRSENEFYSAYGRAITLPRKGETSKTWKDGNCECDLDVTLEESVFYAKGTYKISNSLLGLSMLIGGPSGPIIQTEQWSIEYKGVARGRAIEARITREQIGAKKKEVGLLSDFVNSDPVLLILSDDGNEFRVMQRLKGQEAKFWKITKVSEPATLPST